jgi:hypothetical protein
MALPNINTALEAKEEEKFLDVESQKEKPRTKKVWKKKEITPTSTPAQGEEALFPNPPNT